MNRDFERLHEQKHLRLLNRALDTFEDECLMDWEGEGGYHESCPGISRADAYAWLHRMREQFEELE